MKVDQNQMFKVIPRARGKEEIRVFVSQDLNDLANAKPVNRNAVVALVYPADF